jgi:HD-like signal output (HDOD) protein/DNA-binding response OmpR family regulator
MSNSSNHVVIVFLRQADEDHGLRGRLAEKRMEVVTAQSSEELHRLLNQRRVGAVIIENELDGFLSGVEILERLRDQLLRPVTVLIAAEPAAHHERAARLKVDMVCDWSEVPTGVCDTVHAALRSNACRGLAIPAAARRLVQDCDVIRPMPQLVVKITSYLDDEGASTAQLAQDITADPRMTAELLRLINSAAFGLRNTISHVNDAVAYLGIRRTVSLVLASSVHQMMRDAASQLSEEVMGWFRVRSVLMASVASAFAARLHRVSADTAYVLALLQDLGILVFAHEAGGRYRALLRRHRTVAGLRLDACERLEFAFTHADLTAALLQRWETPVSLGRLVLHHHRPEDDTELSEVDRQFLHLMRLAEAAADMRDVPSPQRHQAFQQYVGLYPPEKRAAVVSCFSEAVVKAVEIGQLFEVPIPDSQTWAEVLDQLKLQCLDGPDETAPAGASEGRSADDSNGGGDDGNGGNGGDDAPSGRPRILLIDDEEQIGRMVRLFLQSEPVDVQVWDRLHSHRDVPADTALVLCDVHVGERSGIEFVGELREAGFAGPVIMLSGDRSRKTVLDSIGAGVADFIPKPFSKQSLIDKLVRHRVLPGRADAPAAPAAAPFAAPCA